MTNWFRAHLSLIERAFLWCLYATLFVPFLYYGQLMYPMNTLKVSVLQVIVEVAFALYLVLVSLGSARPVLTPIRKGLIFFFLALLISAFLGVDVSRSFWSTQDRAIGLIGLLHFGALAFLLGEASRKVSWSWNKFFSVSFWISFVVAFFAVVEILDPSIFFETAVSRPGSFFGNPSYLAVYLLFHVFIGAWLLWERVYKNPQKPSFVFFDALISVGALFQVVILFLTQTRGALLGLAAGIGFLVAWGIYHAGKSRVKHVAIGILGLFIIFGCTFWFTRESTFWQKVPGLARFTNIEVLLQEGGPRLLTWQIAWDSFLERPLFGFGFENFKYPFDTRYNPQFLRYGFGETYFDKPHNVLFEYLVNGGVFGLATYAILFFLLCRVLVMRFSGATPFFLALLIAYVVQNVFIFDTFGSYLMFFIAIGFIDSFSLREGALSSIKHKGESLKSYGHELFPIIGVFVLVGGLASNSLVLYTNSKQYWGLNYFVNGLATEGMKFHAEGLSIWSPYRDTARKDFASALSQIYSQGVPILDINQASKEAMKELGAAIGSRPNDYYLRMVFADLAAVFYVFDSSYLSLGESQGQKALSLSPGRQQIRYSLAKLKTIQGDKIGALALMREAVALDPESFDPHFYYGLTAFAAGDYSLGEREIEIAKKLGREPKNAGEANVLANYYADYEAYDKAIPLYKMALVGRAGDLDSRLKLGLIYFYQGKYDLAREHIGEVAKAIDLSKTPSYAGLLPILRELGLAR